MTITPQRVLESDEQAPADLLCRKHEDGEGGGGEKRRKLEAIETWIQEIRMVVEQEMELEEEEERTAWDDVKGGKLNVKDVEAARREEVGYMQKRGIWSETPIEECWQKTGRAPISIRWVDTDKGIDGQVDGREISKARALR